MLVHRIHRFDRRTEEAGVGGVQDIDRHWCLEVRRGV